jgi:hypothetical protein
MNEDLLQRARLLKSHGIERMNVWTPEGWKAPKGFPRRELMCKPTIGGSTWDVSVARLVAYLEKTAP